MSENIFELERKRKTKGKDLPLVKGVSWNAQAMIVANKQQSYEAKKTLNDCCIHASNRF